MDESRGQGSDGGKDKFGTRVFARLIAADAWVQRHFNRGAHWLMQWLGVTRGFLCYAAMLLYLFLVVGIDMLRRTFDVWTVLTVIITFFFLHRIQARESEDGSYDQWANMPQEVVFIMLALKLWLTFLLLRGGLIAWRGPTQTGIWALPMDRFIGVMGMNTVKWLCGLAVLYLMRTPPRLPPCKETVQKTFRLIPQPSEA